MYCSHKQVFSLWDWTRAVLKKKAKQNPGMGAMWMLGSQTLSLYRSAPTDPHY